MLAIQGHWFTSARRCVSPNQDPRPIPAQRISLLVLHNISLPPGELDPFWVTKFFLNDLDPEAHPYFAAIQGMKVSAHLLIDRLGGLTQFVGFDRRAWHSGESEYEGRPRCNDFSIGIELIGTDDLPYTPQQYSALAHVTESLLAHYPAISTEDIVGHSQIAPGRKTDPGPAFDWKKFRSML